jgi:hypothetical protein
MENSSWTRKQDRTGALQTCAVPAAPTLLPVAPYTVSVQGNAAASTFLTLWPAFGGHWILPLSSHMLTFGGGAYFLADLCGAVNLTGYNIMVIQCTARNYVGN